MELHFKETSVQACQDLARLNKSVQLAMESVVPDTKDDIGRILSVRPEIYLKNKELRNKAVSVAGEALVTVLYINEEETAVSFFSMSQSFSQDYELPSVLDSDCLQLHFSVNGIQARVMNPRKLSVDLEIAADLTVSRSVNVVVSQELPEANQTPIHLRRTEANTVLTTGISEKSISINEQLPFPEGEEQPEEIVGKELCYVVREKECVSSRLLLKGEVLMNLFYFPQGQQLPHNCRFSIPFSQLIDLVDEQSETADVWIEPTSDYISLIDGLDGRKILDVELYALAQTRSGRNQKLQLITDAYSNQMPCECSFSEQVVCESLRELPVRLRSEERIELPEEFQELLSAYPALGPCTVEKGSASVDLLCRSKDGRLFSMRRNLSLVADQNHDDPATQSFRLTDFQIIRDGTQLVVQMGAEAAGLIQKSVTIRRVDTLTLDEEQRFDMMSFPSLTAVWAQTESVWEMAKQYHSSPEAVCEMNQDLSQRPIFVPKTK